MYDSLEAFNENQSACIVLNIIAKRTLREVDTYLHTMTSRNTELVERLKETFHLSIQNRCKNHSNI